MCACVCVCVCVCVHGVGLQMQRALSRLTASNLAARQETQRRGGSDDSTETSSNGMSDSRSDASFDDGVSCEQLK
jgi:hypothetical protein